MHAMLDTVPAIKCGGHGTAGELTRGPLYERLVNL
jgi:hypothetical protein